MKNYSIFDVIGPIMIGPSSSHTAGAARIGKTARDIYHKDFDAVTFYLHGSFQTTLEGHGSDRALVGGVLGYGPEDERLVNSLETAKYQGLKYEFINQDLGDVHPNTIKVEFTSQGSDPYYVTGSSIGGGKIKIININGMEMDITGQYPTIIVNYYDKVGMLVDVLTILKKKNINIATAVIEREENIVSLKLELDDPFTEKILDQIRTFDNIIKVVAIEEF